MMIYWQLGGLFLIGATFGWHCVLIRRNLREIERREALNALLLDICVTAYHARMAPILQALADVTGATVRVQVTLDRGSYDLSILRNDDKSTP